MENARTQPERIPIPGPAAKAAGETGEGTRANDGAMKPFAVYCEKFNGRQYVFQRYATKEQAEAVAKMLRDVGCKARVGAPK